MDEELQATAEGVQKRWKNVTFELVEKVQDVERCGSDGQVGSKVLLPRLNAAVQDRMALLQSLILEIEVISQQLSSEEMVDTFTKKLNGWRNELDEFRRRLRSANRSAKLNLERAAKRERELLFSGGEDATIRRRNLQTQAGMVAGAESITHTLRRTHQVMVQEVERTGNTVQTLDQSNRTLLNTTEEYRGARSILATTKRLLTSMSRSDLVDRAILVVGIAVFLLVCNFIFLKRLGIWRTKRTLEDVYGASVPGYETPSASSEITKPIDLV